MDFFTFIQSFLLILAGAVFFYNGLTEFLRAMSNRGKMRSRLERFVVFSISTSALVTTCLALTFIMLVLSKGIADDHFKEAEKEKKDKEAQEELNKKVAARYYYNEYAAQVLNAALEQQKQLIRINEEERLATQAKLNKIYEDGLTKAAQ